MLPLFGATLIVGKLALSARREDEAERLDVIFGERDDGDEDDAMVKAFVAAWRELQVTHRDPRPPGWVPRG